MTSTPRWLEDEDRLLHKAVACYGHQWAEMKTLGILPGRSSSALRFRWLSISNTERSFVIPTPPCDNILPRMSSSSAPWRSYQHREVRDKTGGRPWDYYVSRTRVREREPSSRQWQLLKLWCLDNPNERLLLCNLGRAEGIMRRWLKRNKSAEATVNEAVLSTQLTPARRDELRLAYKPGEVCHTMTSSNANLYWVCGTGCRQGFLHQSELASFMGHHRDLCLPAIRRHRIPDSLASSWLAESVHHRMAAHCAEVALSMMPPRHRWDLGSLYSGAFDALATGFVAAGACVRRVFAAEVHRRKAEVLSTSFGYLHMYRTAASAATRCPRVDILVASPSCHEVSRARDLSECPLAPVSAVATHGRVIVRAVQRAAPYAVVIEQSDGLRTHHPRVYKAFCDTLNTLPYVWLHRSVDAYHDYNGTHLRARLVWIGVRADIAVL